MFGFFAPHAHQFSPKSFDNQKYLKDLVNTTSETGVMCYEQQCQEGEECCHTVDYGIAYCCAEISGLMYLGVMVGGGFIIALLFICCFVILRGKEKQLEAAAQLEAAKAVSTAMTSAHEAIQLAGEAGSHNADDPHAPPPSYGDVVRTMQRCHSYDVGMLSDSRGQENDVSTSVSRQLSEGCHQHINASAISFAGLPPLPPCSSIDSKLPTYEQCTSAAADLSASSIIAQAHNNLYPVRSNSIQPSEETCDATSSTEHFCRSSNLSGITTPTSPVTVMEEIELSTPTQVDDDTGIVQPATSVLSIHETSVATGLNPEDMPTSVSKDNSVSCTLEFQKNSSNQTEISIGFQRKTELEDVAGCDGETAYHEKEEHGASGATTNDVDIEKVTPPVGEINIEEVNSTSNDDITSSSSDDISTPEIPPVTEHNVIVDDSVSPTESRTSTTVSSSCAMEIEGQDGANGNAEQK